MMRRYALSLMILLTLGIVARIGLALSPHHDEARAEAALSVPPVHAGEVPDQADAASSAGSDPVSLIGTAQASVFPGAPGKSVTAAELEVLGNLRAMKSKLDQRAKALDAREKAAETAEAKATARIAQLQKLEANIQDALKQEQKLKSKKIKKLAAVYDTMKPAKAAPMIELMDLPTTVKLLSRMDQKRVGKILSFMPPAKATQISEALTERIASLQGK